MMGEHIDYEDEWIIDSGCSNHMIDDQRGVMEAGWPLDKEVLPGFGNIEEILSHKTGEKIIHICLSADVSGDPSGTNIGE